MCPAPAPKPSRGTADVDGVAKSRIPVTRPEVELKRWYPVLFELGLSLTILILLGVLKIDLRIDQTIVIENGAPIVVKLEDIEQTEHIVKPPPPPRPAPPVEVPDEVILEDEILEIDAEIDFDAPVDLPPPPPPPDEEDYEEPDIFVIVEEMPVLIGGMERLQELLQYPELAVRAGIEGLVIVSFVVERDGTVTDREVLRSSGDILDNAALAAIAKLEFVPGKQRGKPVRVRFSLPVRFRLKTAENVM